LSFATLLLRSAVIPALVLHLPSSIATAQTVKASAPVQQVIKLDPKGPGRVFDGVGAISASSSLLLYDYPEPQRSQMLDYLFKPKYGASLDIFKFEIGADTNSTTFAEPSHEREPGQINCHRGIEWWMAKEAKARNPEIKLYALMWGAPGWFKNGKLWGDDHVQYLMTWLGCAKENGLHIDYLGGGNERYDPPPPVSFYVALHKALAKEYPDIKIVASDEHAPPNYWHIATEMLSDPNGPASIAILGEHDVCHWRSLYQHCDASADARASGKPLWNSEQSTQDAVAGAEPLARAMNRNYIDAWLTGNINWSIVAGYYGDTNTGGQGLIVAETPWSGAFQVSKSLWVDAHTTQFVRPGWRYLDLASTYLTSGASFVTLYSPKTSDYTVVIESADATTDETVRFAPANGLSTAPASLWVTDLSSTNPADWFVDEGAQAGHGVTVTVKPHHLYTISTVTGQNRNGPVEAALAGKKRAAQTGDVLPLPFREDFEHVDETHRARFFQDQAGAFETAPCEHGRSGTCYRQVVRMQPVLWHNGGRFPSTIVGDPDWWGDYTVATDAMLEEPGYVEVMGRIEQYNQNLISGYHLRIADSGEWQLYSEDSPENTLGNGMTSNRTSLGGGKTEFGVGKWHRIALSFKGDEIVAVLDGRELLRVKDTRHSKGQVGLLVAPWKTAEFDDVTVDKTEPWPTFVPQSAIKAVATSSQPGTYEHRIYAPTEALDGRPESRWSSQLNPAVPMPQSITLDLGKPYETSGLQYTPPGDTGRGGRITRYAIELSADGNGFHEVAGGTWSSSIAAKTVRWRTKEARFVRLTAQQTVGAGAAASELNVLCEQCQK
jgi:O-glycosyl hydrolase